MPTSSGVTYQIVEPDNTSQVSGTTSAPDENGITYAIGSVPQTTSAAPSAQNTMWDSLKNFLSTKGALEGMPGGQFITADPGAANTAAKAAISSIPNLLANFSHGLDTGVNALNKAIYPKSLNVPQLQSPTTFLPSSLEVTPEEKILHPVANAVFSTLGALPLGAGTEAATSELLPSLMRLKEFGEASRLKSVPYGLVQGALQGGIYSAPGSTAAGTALGAITGGTLAPILSGAGAVNEHLQIDPAELQANADAAEAEHNAQLASIENAKISLPKGAGSTKISALKKIAQTQSEIDNLNQEISGVTPNPTLENIFAGKNAQERMEAAKNIIAESQQDLADTHQAQSDQLPNPSLGNTDNTEIGTLGKQAFLNEKGSFRNTYDGLKNEASQINLTVPDLSDLTDMPKYSSDLDDSVSNNSEDKLDALTALGNVGNQKQINGQQLLSLYKATRDAAGKAESRANAYNVGEDVRIPARGQANRLNAIKDRLYQTMQSNFPSELMNGIESTDRAYGQQIMPFYKSPIFSSMMENGKVPNNFLESIAGNEPHQRVFQSLVKNNPELNRASLSQAYRENPESLLQYNPATEPFIQADPITSGLRENQQLAQKNLDNAQNISDQVKAQNPDQANIDKLNSLNDYLTNLKSAHENHMNELQKGQVTAQKFAQMQKAVKDYNSVRSKIKGHLKGNLGKSLLGFGRYGAHYLAWHELSKLFWE